MTPIYDQLTSQKAKIQLAIQAFDLGQIHSEWQATALYDVPQSSLNNWHTGHVSKRKIRPKSAKLTTNEEQVVIDHILDLDSQGFPPWYVAVWDMADKLLGTRDQSKMGINWPNNFIGRVLGLKPMFNWKYSYWIALQEDLKVIKG